MQIAACTLQGMQDEVELLKDCADCARVQADVLQQLGRSDLGLDFGALGGAGVSLDGLSPAQLDELRALGYL